MKTASGRACLALVALAFMGIAWTGCCGDGGLTVVEGEWPVAPGGSVSFRFDFDGDFIAGPEKTGTQSRHVYFEVKLLLEFSASPGMVGMNMGYK